MLQTLLSPFVVILGTIIGGYCFFKSIASLPTALHLLVFVLFFGGIVATNLGSGGIAIPFRDIFIVLPLYICVFTTRAGQIAATRIPVDLLLSIVFFLVVMAVCLFSPSGPPLAQMAIGLKVWLFYIPFLAVGIALGHRPDLMTRLFRQILFWGAIACAVGLLQSLLVRILGYDAAMRLFFGEYASRVTQGFTRFDEAGGIYRIPATFSFAAQYGGFLCLYLTIAMIMINADPAQHIRRFARIAVFVAFLAAVLSGTRALVLVFPAMLAAYTLCGILSVRLLLLAPAGIAVVTTMLALAGADPVAYFFVGEKLARFYTSDFIFEQISSALDNGLIGAGIGTVTIGARYLFGGTAIDEGWRDFYESYFAKAAAELGWIGFAAIVAIFIVIATRAATTTRANFRRPENAVVAPIAVYIAYTIITSFKGFALDIDPGNIFFWLLLGLMVGVDGARRHAVIASDEAGYLQDESEVYDAT